MGRNAKLVNKDKLKEFIKIVEMNHGDLGLSAGWEKVAELYSEEVEQISAGPLKKQGLTLNLENKKKIGNPNLYTLRPDNSGPRENKGRPTPEHIELMKNRLIDHKANRFLGVVDKIEAGSVKAAIKLFCLECVSYDINEVRACSALACPLYHLRPYKQEEANDQVNSVGDYLVDSACNA